MTPSPSRPPARRPLALLLAVASAATLGASACDRPLPIGDPTVVNLGTATVVYGALALPDGKILVTGRSNKDKQDTLMVARFLSGGGLDPSFGNGNPAAGVVLTPLTFQNEWSAGVGYALALQSDGRILVAGRAWPLNLGAKTLVVRYLPDGTLDGTFGTGGYTLVDPNPNHVLPVDSSGPALSIVVNPDDTFVTGGAAAVNHAMSSMYWSDWAMVKFTRNGLPDATWGVNGAHIEEFGWSAFIHSMVRLDDGRLVVAGESAHHGSGSDMTIARYHADGTLDPAFGTKGITIINLGGESDVVYSLAVQKDGKYLLGGTTSSDPDGKITSMAVARVDDKGVLDPSFGTSAGTTVTQFPGGTSAARGLVITGDGFWLGGYALAADGHSDMAMARYTANGLLDTSCPNDKGWVTVSLSEFDDAAYAMVAQPDKTPVLAGNAGDHFAIDRFTELRCGVTVSTH